MSTTVVVFAALGAKALLLLYIWLLSAILASILSKSKGYGEKPGLGTGLMLTVLGPLIWLAIPPKDELAEWHERKPWQRRHRPQESEMAEMHVASMSEAMADAATTSGADAAAGDPGAGSRPGESRD